MTKLNLAAKGDDQIAVLNYLQQNATDVLADKINNGVQIVKDGVTLINKKTLDGFFRYATEEARKLVAKDVRCACVLDRVVFGWAIHYFEEDFIEGTLYNLDGTEYKTVKPMATPTVTTKSVITKPKKNEGQLSIFDMTLPDDEPNDTDEDVCDGTDDSDEVQAVCEPTNQPTAQQVSIPIITHNDTQSSTPTQQSANTHTDDKQSYAIEENRSAQNFLNGITPTNTLADAETRQLVYVLTPSELPTDKTDFVLSAWAKADSAYVVNARKADPFSETLENDCIPNFDLNQRRRKFELAAEVYYNNGDIEKFTATYDWLNTDWQYLTLPIELQLTNKSKATRCPVHSRSYLVPRRELALK